MSDAPLVSVIVPARNEEPHIERCLAAIAAQDHPHQRLEVIVVDGGSTDATATRARRALASMDLRSGSVVANPVGTTPSNLNLALARATGTIVCRVDARSIIPPHYVSRCADLLAARPGVAVVGGAQVAVPPQPGDVGAGIARALNNRWAMGLSRYRRGATSGPSDTVYLGAFRTEELRAVGGWDERLPTNQDFDLNRRMGRFGAVWFDDSLDVGYVPRSTVADLFRQYSRFGRWKVRYWRLSGDRPRPRQVVMLGVPTAAALAVPTVLVGARPAGRVLAVAAALAGGAAVEVLGSRRPRTGPAGHVVGAAAIAAVWTGWVSGAWMELVRGRAGE